MVGDIERFAADHWGSAPLHLVGDTSFDDVLTLEQFDAWLASSPRRPTVRLVQDGANLPDRAYCRPLRLGSKSFDDVIDLERVLDRFRSGATIAAQSLHRLLPSVIRFAADLEEQISHRVQVNAYLTPVGGVGLTPHRDGHDVIVLQIHGTKRWTVESLGEIVIRRGDRLYIPAGTTHHAATEDEASLHLTIGIHPLTGTALLKRALDTIECRPHRLPLGYAHLDDQELAALVGKSIGNTIDQLVQLDHHELAGRLRSRRSHDSIGLLTATLMADHIDDTTVVRRRVPATIEHDADGDRVVLRFGETTMSLPAAAHPTLELLGAGAPTAVGDFPGLDPASRLVVARRLILDGYLLVATAPW